MAAEGGGIHALQSHHLRSLQFVSLSTAVPMALFGDYSANFDEAAQFAGMPDTIVPWATPAEADKPTALLPPPATVEAEPKKGSLER